MAHLTEADFQDYGDRRLSPERLLALDAHLQACPECERRLAASGRWQSAHSLVSAEMAGRHPEYEALAGYLDGTLMDAERASLCSHLDRCERCRAGLAEMRAVDGVLLNKRDGLFVTPGPLLQRLGQWAAPAGAVVGLAVGLAGGMALQQSRITGLEREQRDLLAREAVLTVEARDARAAADRLRSQLARAPGPVLPPTEGVTHPAPKRRAAPVPAKPPGLLAHAKVFPPEAAEAVREGRLNFPASLAELIGTPEITRGTEGSPEHVRLKSPVGTAVATPQPQLIWEPVAGATTYEVVLLEGERLVRSGPLTEARWRPSESLRRGAIYTWQVSAEMPDGARVATRAPQPRFRVLDAAAAKRVQSYQQRYRHEPLILGVLLVRDELLEDAEGELRRASENAPRSETAAKLLKQLRARRGGS